MGLFDFLTKEGRKKRHIQRMSDQDAHAEDREGSAHWLAEEGSPQAIMGLLSRFDLNLSQRVKDSAEKQFVYDLLVQMGEPALRPTRSWLKQCKQVAWPLRLLETLEGEAACLEAVYGMLDKEAARQDFKPEKKKQLLVWLSERVHAGAIEHAAPHLKDFDEDVRYLAAEVLAAQQDDTARAPLLAALENPEEDSNRVRHRLSEVFMQRRWAVDANALEGRLPSEYTVRDDRIVRA